MKRRIGLGAVIAALLATAIGCSYPDFVFNGAGGAGGQGATAGSTGDHGASSADGSSSSSSSHTSSTSHAGSTSHSSSGGPACTLDHLVISEIRTRGPGGAADEFVELYNPTPSDVTLDPSWSVQNRGSGALTYGIRWSGSGETIPAHGHFLIAGSGYFQDPPPDAMLAAALSSDSASMVLAQDLTTTIDAVCFFFDSGSLFVINNGFYTCEGMPVDNPHDDATGTNTDKSLERRPGGGLGNCADTDDNASDFAIRSPATPENTLSPPVP
jgi:hypothetical protein